MRYLHNMKTSPENAMFIKNVDCLVVTQDNLSFKGKITIVTDKFLRLRSSVDIMHIIDPSRNIKSVIYSVNDFNSVFHPELVKAKPKVKKAKRSRVPVVEDENEVINLDVRGNREVFEEDDLSDEDISAEIAKNIRKGKGEAAMPFIKEKKRREFVDVQKILVKPLSKDRYSGHYKNIANMVKGGSDGK